MNPQSSGQPEASSTTPASSPPPLPRAAAANPPPFPAKPKKQVLRLALWGVVGISVFGAFGLVLAALVRFAIPTGVGVSGVRESKSEAGVTYKQERVDTEPWSIHRVEVDRTRKDLTFYSVHAKNRILGVSLISEQARGIPTEVGRAIAGVNGDFYVRDDATYGGDPRGIQIVDGELISGPSTVCVWFDTEGDPHLDEVKGDFKVTWDDGRTLVFGLNEQRRSNMAVLYTPTYGSSTRASGGRELVLESDGKGEWLPLRAGRNYQARVRDVQHSGNSRLAADVMVLSLASELFSQVPEVSHGAMLKISTATIPDLSSAKTAIAGGPAVIKDGKPFSSFTAPPGTPRDFSVRSKYERHPRSAVGWNRTHFYFVTVDGRQPGLSVGMKLAELAQYMMGLGCTDAMNLDGGKSAQLWMNGEIMNSPCQGEDTVANALFIVRRPETK